MKKTIIFSLTLLISLLAFSSCKVEVINKDKAQVKAKAINVKDFNAIDIAYPAEVTYIPSDTFGVTVKAPADAMDNISVGVNDGTLQIKRNEMPGGENKHYIFYSGDNDHVRITVKAPTLSSVYITGSGDFDCNATMKAQELELYVIGSGDIDIKNIVAQSVSVSVSGSGDIDAGLTGVANTKASIAGSGDIELKLRNCGHVEANVSGSGDIDISGNVKSLSQNVSGSGDIDINGLSVGK